MLYCQKILTGEIQVTDNGCIELSKYFSQTRNSTYAESNNTCEKHAHRS